jgi:ribonuclease HII
MPFWRYCIDKTLVCGVDEAGRGPLAGPVYAAAVILDPARRVNGLADSKVLTAERREVLAGRIKERALAWAVAHASVEEIDRINILRASLLAMRRAVEALKVVPQEAWIDGNMCPDLACAARAIVDGDATHKPISAASILAKTARDAEMCALHDRFPQYGFDQHKGYATAEHLEAVGRLGPCEIHRRSFHAVGVFFQGNLFSESWAGMAESLRTRSYRLYCEAMKLSNATKQLAHFDFHAKRLKRTYADVFAAREAASHVEMVRALLRDTRAQLRGR